MPFNPEYIHVVCHTSTRTTSCVYVCLFQPCTCTTNTLASALCILWAETRHHCLPTPCEQGMTRCKANGTSKIHRWLLCVCNVASCRVCFLGRDKLSHKCSHWNTFTQLVWDRYESVLHIGDHARAKKNIFYTYYSSRRFTSRGNKLQRCLGKYSVCQTRATCSEAFWGCRKYFVLNV